SWVSSTRSLPATTARSRPSSRKREIIGGWRATRVGTQPHGIPMLTVASLLAAMTIAGAFWVGVLAARRLRDWGEGRRALEDGGPSPLALAAVSGAPPDDPGSRRVRALVAQRIKDHRWSGDRTTARGSGTQAGDTAPPEGELTLTTLRVGDVVVLDGGDPELGSDFITEGVINLREGGTTTVVANLSD